MRRMLHYVVLISVVMSVTLLYWMSSSFGRFSFQSGSPESPFALLSNAFLSGNLHLEVTPDPQLLRLDNPYDPAKRGAIPFLWDLVLYKGKYFVYWGPVPALLMYIPSRLLLGMYPDEHLIILGLSLLTVAAITIIAIQGAFALSIPLPKIIPWWLLYVAFAGPLPLQLGGGVYVVAALTAVLFQVVCIGLLIQLLTNERHSYRWAFGAGLAQILAVGSRPTLGLSVIAAVTIIAIGLRDRGIREIVKVGVVFALPIALGGSLLLLYNWARFESPFEVGANYQLTLADLSNSALCSFQSGYSWQLIHTQLWQHFYRAPEFVPHFPYLNFQNAVRFGPSNPPGYIGNDAVTGLLLISPLLLIGTIGLLCFVTALNKACRVVCFGLLMTACANTLFLTSCRFAAARYAFEIYAPWLICSLWGTWLLMVRIQGAFIRPIIRTTVVAVMFVSISVGILGTFDGHFHKNIQPSATLARLRAVILPAKTPANTESERLQ